MANDQLVAAVQSLATEIQKNSVTPSRMASILEMIATRLAAANSDITSLQLADVADLTVEQLTKSVRVSIVYANGSNRQILLPLAHCNTGTEWKAGLITGSTLNLINTNNTRVTNLEAAKTTLQSDVARLNRKQITSVGFEQGTSVVRLKILCNDNTTLKAEVPFATKEGTEWRAGLITGATLNAIDKASSAADAARALAQSASATAEAASDNAAEAMRDAGTALTNSADAKATANAAKAAANDAVGEMVLPIKGIAPSRWGGQLIGGPVDGMIFCREEQTFYESVTPDVDLLSVYGGVVAKAAPGVDVELQGRNLLLHTNHYTANTAEWENPITHNHQLFTMLIGNHATAPGTVVRMQQYSIALENIGVPGVGSGEGVEFAPRSVDGEYGTPIEDEGYGIDRNNSNTWQAILYPIRLDALKPDAQYTVSWKTKYFGKKMSAVLGNSSQAIKLTDVAECDCTSIPNSDGVRTHKATITTRSAAVLEDAANSNQQMYLLLTIPPAATDETPWVRFSLFDLKMEEGAAATAWTPAPEDACPPGAIVAKTTDPRYAQVVNRQPYANPNKVYRLGSKIYHYDAATGRLLRYLDESDLESIHP